MKDVVNTDYLVGEERDVKAFLWSKLQREVKWILDSKSDVQSIGYKFRVCNTGVYRIVWVIRES